MSIVGLMKAIGKRGSIMTRNGLRVSVVVRDVKANSYGKTRYLIAPIAGGGETWVEHIEFDEEAKPAQG